MNKKLKVVIRIEYECDGKRKICYGKIDKRKLDNFDKGEGSYILMENDGNVYWVYKESVISIERLSVKSSVFERPRITDYVNDDADTGICI
jgi:hypothetical protein